MLFRQTAKVPLHGAGQLDAILRKLEQLQVLGRNECGDVSPMPRQHETFVAHVEPPHGLG